jgi:conjugative relaxase-like TrwC/TraI family protein
MLNISKALSSGQAQKYHKLEFASETANYYKQDGTAQGEWQGQLAAKMGLSGTVTAEDFARLTVGRHPHTDEQMVKHREGQEYKNADGSITKPVEHRAGWDATFSAPKSVSLTALVGGDGRVREAHREAVTVALTELERYTQARIGGNNPAETTGQFIAAKFEHDTSRPVDGYAAPQLHTHAVIFNVTQREDGTGTGKQARALQPQGLFDSQNYATAVYQSVLTYRLRDLGYEIEAGRSGAPEIKGYSQDYLDASSPRSQQIRNHLEKSGQSGPGAAQIAAHATRDKKQILTPEQVLSAHRKIAESFGNEAATVVSQARKRAQVQAAGPRPEEALKARDAIKYSRSSNFEREAVVDERAILRDALRYGMGETSFEQVRSQLNARMDAGDFVQRQGRKHDSGRSFTTPETIASERANVAHVMRGQHAVQPMMDEERALAQASRKSFLNPAQRTVIQEVLTSSDRIHGLQGLAGTGKTSVLSSIREGAEQSGYAVEGFAPTSRAAGQLREAGISATTLQSFLARGGMEQTAGDSASRHLYMLDESSLASTTQMRAFLDKIQLQDRVLLIGDTQQHQGVDAGRPFQEMQEAGMRTSQLDQIMRQKDPELLRAVQHLATGQTEEGVRLLKEQGRVTEVKDGNYRIAAIAKDYTDSPENTIIVSPDNRSRQAINQAVRTELHANGTLETDDREFRTLSQRSDMTGADREWAARYQPGDIVQYTTGSKALQIGRDTLATVVSADGRSNTLTVMRENGHTVTYDPTRLKGVNVYREVTREFATGDRIQFTANTKDLGISNRDIGTIQKMEEGRITVQMGSSDGRTLSFDPAQVRTFDHGYAVTSHSSQGLTAGRVIVNIDTDSSRTLINNRLAYVAVSRASDDVRIYTNDAETLGSRLATEVTKTAALDFSPATRQTRRDSSAPTLHQYANPDHRLAAVALAYSERPGSTVVVARDPAERGELNQLIRSDLQRNGQVAPDSTSVTVYVEQPISDRRLASQYTPGDLIQYQQGSPKVEGIAHNSTATVLSVEARTNSLTVQTVSGDEVTYSPHLLKTVTAGSIIYRQEQREFVEGDRVLFTRADPDQGIRKGELGTITGFNDFDGFDVRLDKGSDVQLSTQQTRNLDHGYAVDSISAGSPQKILFTQEAATDEREIASLSRNGREVDIYTSDGTLSQKQEAQVQPWQNQMTQSPAAIPQQPHVDSPAIAKLPQPTAPAIRMRIGR